MEIGQKLSASADSATWWLGDWLVYGQNRYPERYHRAIAETSLDYQTLRNYAWIARKVPPDRRRPALSMQHHAEVAALDPEHQEAWLDRAELGRWSRNELRRRIRAAGFHHSALQLPSEELRLVVSPTRRRAWKQAAAQADCELTEWMVGVLDAAARAGSGVESLSRR